MSFSRLPLVFLAFLSTQAINANAATPRDSPALAESFMSSFMSAIGRSGEFTASQLDNMQTIAETMIASVNRMSRSGRTSGSKLQALNRDFASAMAEIGVGANIEAITNGLNSAFLQTTGASNQQIVNELPNMVSNAYFNSLSTSPSAGGGSRGGGSGGYSSAAAAAAASSSGSGPSGPSGIRRSEPGSRGTQEQGPYEPSAGGHRRGTGQQGRGPRGLGPRGQGPNRPAATSRLSSPEEDC